MEETGASDYEMPTLRKETIMFHKTRQNNFVTKIKLLEK